MSKIQAGSLTVLLLSLAITIAGCAGRQIHTNSSVVEYLYPSTSERTVVPATPRLELPLRVGIAFVPDSKTRIYGSSGWAGPPGVSGLTETKKEALLELVANNFRELDFISSIEVIPSAYLTPQGSFTNLDQLKSIYGVDVVALVSYDQVQFTDENFLSLSYWTIVGAYVVSGEKNDTNTLMDTVVYDIHSRDMLFRAPGKSRVKGSSTPINLSEELRRDSTQGFEDATNEMIAALQLELEEFQEKLKESPEDVVLVYKEGYEGGSGGAAGAELLFFLLLVAVVVYRRRQDVPSS